ncbi:H-NS histone family protein [Bradyrhizobium symbiodeficiens]|uniref:H-NS histone family protein n=1 Tax=Bradyrhizobium symbiodeficiens TaxID=1404367 RepID=UPI0030CD1C76
MKLSASSLESLSVVELTDLYERIRPLLAKRIEQEKRRLESTLAKLNSEVALRRVPKRRLLTTNGSHPKRRRKYPPVLPKYRNPTDRSETWAGRGKQPRWLVSELRAGKKLEDFLIKKTATVRGA